MLHMIPEYLVVELPPNEDEPQCPKLEAGDGQSLVDINDPRLNEPQWEDPSADAYATHAAVKIMIHTSGEPCSVSVRWN